MKKRGGTYLTVFSLLLLLLALFFSIAKLSQEPKLPPVQPVIEPKSLAERPFPEPDAGWLGKSANLSQKSLLYPAEEIYLQWDLVPPGFRKEPIYRLRFPPLDQYQLSCLNQVIENRELKTDLRREEDRFMMELTLKDRRAAESLLDELKHYDIRGTLEKTYQFKPYEEGK